jgi:hypothetical protein
MTKKLSPGSDDSHGEPVEGAPVSHGEPAAPRLGRRTMLGGAALALAGATAGTILSSAGVASANPVPQPPQPPAPSSPPGIVGTTLHNAHFGFEAHPLDGDGVDVYFEVTSDMVLEIADIDTALMILTLPTVPGFVEVLCAGLVFRGGPPTGLTAPHAFFSDEAISPDFGATTSYNPGNVELNAAAYLSDGWFYSAIMKAWVPADGTASATHRHVHATPALYLAKGDYVLFHMDQAGVPCDAEMQGVLAYRLV